MDVLIHQSVRSLIYSSSSSTDSELFISKVCSNTKSSKTEIIHEYELTRSLNIPGIRKPFKKGVLQNKEAIFYKFFNGVTIKEFCTREPISILNFLRLFSSVADTLSRLHQEDIVHLRINSNNILVNPESVETCIIDFSLASHKMNARAANFMDWGDELAYIAPEQTGHLNKVIDQRTDLYSLGIVMFECWCAQVPFQNSSPSELIHDHLVKLPSSLLKMRTDTPEFIAAIVDKLLRKNSEQRYQTSSGLAYDLALCLKQWSNGDTFTGFHPGAQDYPGDISLSRNVYGRKKELDTLVKGLDAIKEGDNRNYFIHGEPGMGKSLLMDDFARYTEQNSGLFLSGGFGKQTTHIPNRAMVKAFETLATFILSQPDEKLQEWKETLLLAVSDIGQLLIDMVPDFQWIIGVQPALPQLNVNQLESRIHFLFQRLLEALAGPEHPLVIYIDNLHWADASSWKTFKHLLSGNTIGYLMFVFVHQLDEGSDEAILSAELASLEAAGLKHETMQLKGLQVEDIEAFIKDSFVTHDTAELSAITFAKTLGNPFFIHKFLRSLSQQHLLNYFAKTAQWEWNKDAVQAVQMTENVVAFIIDRVKSLPVHEQRILMIASCIGNTFTREDLTLVSEEEPEVIAHDLSFYFSENLCEQDDQGNCRFVHDSIQQTAYELMPERERNHIHYKIAVQLYSKLTEQPELKDLFTLANHFNLGSEFITEDERTIVSPLIFNAGKGAKKTASFELAYEYFKSIIKFSRDTDWEEHYEFMLSLYQEAAETGMITGDPEEALTFLNTSLKRARNLNDRLKAHEIKMVHLNETHQFADAINYLLQVLDEIGYGVHRHPSKGAILKEFIQLKLQFIGKKTGDILQLPPMQDERARAFINLAVTSSVSIFGYAPDILPIMNFRQVRLSLKYGNSEISPFSYAGYGFALTTFMGDVNQGYAMAKMALALVDKLNSQVIKAKVLVVFHGFLSYWKDSFVEAIGPLREAYNIGRQTGDLLYASFAASFYNDMKLSAGYNLPEILESMSEDCITIKGLNQELVYLITQYRRQFVFNVSQSVAQPWELNSDGFNENKCLASLEKLGDKASKFGLYTTKLSVACIFNEYEICYQNYELARQFEEETSSRQIIYPSFLFYSLIAVIRLAQTTAYKDQFKDKRIKKELNKLKSFSLHAPQNFENKYVLLEALLLEKTGSLIEVAAKYQIAIDLSSKNGFIHEEAIAREHFALYLLQIGQPEFGELMLRRAYECYQNWGAHNKCRQLSQKHESLKSLFSANSIDTGISGLQNIYDLNTIIRSNQVLSSENSIEGLVRMMVELVIANASTSKVVIILKTSQLNLRAYAMGTQESISILDAESVDNQKYFPHSVIQYVMHSGCEFVSPNLTKNNRHNFDLYVKNYAPVSVCCIPITAKSDFLGALYFENNLTEFAFDKKRVEFFTTIAAQLAISLDNVYLYSEMEQKVKDRTFELQEKNNELTVEKKKSDDLLLNILPAETAMELKNFGKTTARRYDAATILFSDIKNFTIISEQLAPEELVNELDICFRKFDEIVIRNGLEKIKTVGDAYIAVGGVPDNNTATPVAVVKAAMEMQEFSIAHVAERKRHGKPGFEVRIGINTGPVVTGVVGIKKFQYDIWGDAVNVAARMEQYSEPGRINLSSSTFHLVKHQFQCEYRGKNIVKSLGEVDMYFVNGFMTSQGVVEQ